MEGQSVKKLIRGERKVVSGFLETLSIFSQNKRTKVTTYPGHLSLEDRAVTKVLGALRGRIDPAPFFIERKR